MTRRDKLLAAIRARQLIRMMDKYGDQDDEVSD
jgi:hypothetical protein